MADVSPRNHPGHADANREDRRARRPRRARGAAATRTGAGVARADHARAARRLARALSSRLGRRGAYRRPPTARSPPLLDRVQQPVRSEDEVHLTVARIDTGGDGAGRPGRSKPFPCDPSGAGGRARLRRIQRPLPLAGRRLAGPDHDRHGHRHRALPRLRPGARGDGRTGTQLALLRRAAFRAGLPVPARVAARAEAGRSRPHRSRFLSRWRAASLCPAAHLGRRPALYEWIENGAILYVCGDATRMAPDVHAALAGVIARHGGLSPEAAREQLDRLGADGRYLRDVY